MKNRDEDDGGDFAIMLGVFGESDKQKRARAEQLASMRTNDKRRRQGPPRRHQYNGRLTEAHLELAKACEAALTKSRGTRCGPSEVIEAGIDILARKLKLLEKAPSPPSPGAAGKPPKSKARANA